VNRSGGGGPASDCIGLKDHRVNHGKSAPGADDHDSVPGIDRCSDH
jgi:hypothetical protein